MGRRVYTNDDKARALDLYRQHGLAHAAHETGIPKTTIRDWATHAGVRTYGTEQTAAATEARKLTFAQRRAQLADDLLTDADRLRQQLWQPARVWHWTKEGSYVDQTHDEPPYADKQRIMTALAIAVDKAQLLAGEATARTETGPAGLDVHRLRDELAARRDRTA